MTYFNKQWLDEVVLPDGSVAGCQQDVDRYLQRNNLALAQDYSEEYRKNIRLNNERERRKDFFAEFIRNYKRSIWNA